MGTTSEKKALDQLEKVIKEAMDKVKAPRETKLGQYIPWKNGTLHHLRFLKLKKNEPAELKKMIQEHILAKSNPELIAQPPRQKQPTSESKSYLDQKKKRVFEIKLKRSQIERLVQLCEKTGSEFNDLIEILQEPLQEKKPTLEQVTKWMKEMLREKKIDKKLLSTYEQLLKEETTGTMAGK